MNSSPTAVPAKVPGTAPSPSGVVPPGKNPQEPNLEFGQASAQLKELIQSENDVSLQQRIEKAA